MATEIKLGLCNPPEPIYLFVNQGEVDGESYVWYKFNINQDKKIPVSQRALIGYLSELRLTRGTSIIGTENRDKKHYMNTTKKFRC